MKEMKPTASSGVDGLSLKTIKRITKPLLKSILNLVNTTINTATYPKSLKISRVVPLRKGDKNPTNPLNYRAINILPSLGKIIDRVINKQMTRHLYLNKLFLQQHHGAVKGRSTMTAIISMLDDWAEGLEKGENNLVLVLDQSAAYDVICHKKLIQKLKLLGCDNNAINFFTDYLVDRQQTVTIETFQSDFLHSGPISVCQGSTLSGLLYLIYTLDYPLIFDQSTMKIE